jgi:hypothetical protein
MKTERFFQFIGQISRGESNGAHLAVGAMLIVSILYASTMT